MKTIIEANKHIIPKLIEYGILRKPDEIDVRSYNIGKSNYAEYIIQPWAIWIDHNLNAFDADIVKRVLRHKVEEGMTEKESRIMDYEKIIHICNERIRQLDAQDIKLADPISITPEVVSPEEVFEEWEPKTKFSLSSLEEQRFTEFKKRHHHCHGLFSVQCTPTGIGSAVEVKCTVCGEVKDITDYDSW